MILVTIKNNRGILEAKFGDIRKAQFPLNETFPWKSSQSIQLEDSLKPNSSLYFQKQVFDMNQSIR